jgi:hypothetical protein
MTARQLADRANQREQRGHDRTEPPLQPARRPDANQLPHQQSEIETADVDQQTLQDVRVTTEVHAAHSTGLVEMSEGPLQALPAKPQQAQPSRAANPSTIAIDCGASLELLLPVASPTIRF